MLFASRCEAAKAVFLGSSLWSAPVGCKLSLCSKCEAVWLVLTGRMGCGALMPCNVHCISCSCSPPAPQGMSIIKCTDAPSALCAMPITPRLAQVNALQASVAATMQRDRLSCTYSHALPTVLKVSAIVMRSDQAIANSDAHGLLTSPRLCTRDLASCGRTHCNLTH